MKKIFIYCLVLVFIVAGCKKESSKQPTLINTQWVLSYIQDTKSNVINNYPADESKKIVIDFTNLSNVISFNGICNSGSGKYSFSASTGTVEITDIATTKIACKYVEWEGYTIQSLNKAYSYKVNGSNLTFYTNGDYNLYFIKK
jgi:heat shock protein HslJ